MFWDACTCGLVHSVAAFSYRGKRREMFLEMVKKKKKNKRKKENKRKEKKREEVVVKK